MKRANHNSRNCVMLRAQADAIFTHVSFNLSQGGFTFDIRRRTRCRNRVMARTMMIGLAATTIRAAVRVAEVRTRAGREPATPAKRNVMAATPVFMREV